MFLLLLHSCLLSSRFRDFFRSPPFALGQASSHGEARYHHSVMIHSKMKNWRVLIDKNLYILDTLSREWCSFYDNTIIIHHS